MNKVHIRKVGVALILAISAITATSGLALAASYSYTAPTVSGTAGSFTADAKFSAKWSATRTVSAAGTDWTITNFEMQALIVGGRACLGFYCSSFSNQFTADFLKPDGTTSAVKVSVTGSACYTAPIISTKDLWIARCKTSIKYHTNATSWVQLGKVKLTWNVDLYAANFWFFDNVWSTTKSVTFS